MNVCSRNLLRPAFLALLLGFSTLATAQQGARDAEAILNRCGKPLKGDEIVLDNSGGKRTLSYERGVLLFKRVGNNGWQFQSGSHKSASGLDAQQMAAFMPCLLPALADSAADAPLKPITSMQRMETSAKSSYKQLIMFVFGGLLLIGAFLFLLSRRKSADAED